MPVIDTGQYKIKITFRGELLAELGPYEDRREAVLVRCLIDELCPVEDQRAKRVGITVCKSRLASEDTLRGIFAYVGLPMHESERFG